MPHKSPTAIGVVPRTQTGLQCPRQWWSGERTLLFNHAVTPHRKGERRKLGVPTRTDCRLQRQTTQKPFISGEQLGDTTVIEQTVGGHKHLYLGIEMKTPQQQTLSISFTYS